MHLFHKVTAVGTARCIDNKQTYQLTQLFDDTIGNIINLFHLECVVFLRQGYVGLLITGTRPTL